MFDFLTKIKNYFSSSSKQKIILILLVGVILLASILFLFFSKKTEQKLLNNSISAQEQNILNAVSQKIKLPTQENPQIILITDSQYIRNNQPFFAQAENGDVMIVYSSYLVLYRPSEDRVVNSGPVIKPQEKSNFTVEVRNGSGITGRAKLWKDKLEKVGYKVTTATNAEKGNYEKTMVMFKPGVNFPEIISFVRGDFITILPDGEKPINSDILVILGKDS
jgi:hypothetical protein